MGKPKNLREQVLALHGNGKSYNEICQTLNCSKGTVAYHCGEGQKEKTQKRNQRNNLTKTLCNKVWCFQRHRAISQKKETYASNDVKLLRDKIYSFQRERPNGKYVERSFERHDVLDKFGFTTVCYLTGRPVNLLEPKTYQFDHIKPVSQGGNFSIENLGIACKEANQAKHKLTTEEFIQLCKEVLVHNGYEVKKI